MLKFELIFSGDALNVLHFFGKLLLAVALVFVYLTSKEVQISSTVRFSVSSAMSCP